MNERIILSIVALAMLALTLKKGDKLTTFLTTGLAFGILITWTGISSIITVGLLIYMLTALLISITSLKISGLSKIHKTTILLTGIFAFVANLFSIMHWPYAGEVRLSIIIPIILYLVSIFSGMIKRQELGYLTIMNVDFLFHLIR